MKVQIDTKTKEWIEAKGSHVTVKPIEGAGCCFAGIQQLLATPKKPKSLQMYKEYNVNGLSIYVKQDVMLKNTLILKLSGMGFFKSITVKVAS